MTTSVFGEHTRRERELRGVSLEEVSAATRISVTFLEALERGDWEKLPGGVFRRGFIRSVGRFLGLDEENLIAEYALETGDTPQAAVPAKAAGPDLRHGLFFGGAAAAVLLILASFFAWRHFAHRPHVSVNQATGRHTDVAPQTRAGRADTPEVSTGVLMKDAASPTNSATESGSTRNAGPPSQITPASALPLSPPAERQGEPAAGREAGSQQPSGTPGDTASHSSVSSAPVAHSSEPADSSNTQNSSALLPTGLSLHILATRETRVRILADGEEIYKGTMTAGQWRNFRAVEGMDVFAEDGSAIQLELNGKPVRDGGAAGEPLHVTLPLGGAGVGSRQ